MDKQRNRRPRLLSETERTRLDEFVELIHYSDRHVFVSPGERRGFLVPMLIH